MSMPRPGDAAKYAAARDAFYVDTPWLDCISVRSPSSKGCEYDNRAEACVHGLEK
jgi:hypothetical protein